jgi:hypothetical protein
MKFVRTIFNILAYLNSKSLFYYLFYIRNFLVCMVHIAPIFYQVYLITTMF